MSRKLKIALTGLLLILTTILANSVLAATRRMAELHNQGDYQIMALPIIIQIVYLLLGGAVSLAYLIWAFNNHKWPFS